jgi:hypothetical protein
MSCDYCKEKRSKCLRSSATVPCLACSESGKQCRTTIPRKQRSYGRAPSTQDTGQIGNSHQVSLEIRQTTDSPPRVEQCISPSETASPTPRIWSLLYPSHENDSSGIENGAVITSQLKPTSAERLFEDDLGLPRYVGPTGSYTFMVRLREIMAVKSAPKTADPKYAQTKGQSVQLFDPNGKEPRDLPPRPAADALVELFFRKVHCDFPTFHRALFQASYEGMWSPLPCTEPAWLMALGMVFVLGLDAALEDSLPMLSRTQKRVMKERYLNTAKELLPDVLSGCTLGHVQAIMLYCRHLYISGNRNASWSLTGLAIRIAIAIGLHRNGINAKCSPLERELRKRVWWTLYAFERIECSSLGRASAIDDEECSVGFPTEGLLDMGDILPLGHVAAQSQLLMMLGTICKQQYGLDILCRKQVDITNIIFQNLSAWHNNLSAHLRLESGSPKTHRRAIILLHIQYHYTVTLLCRPFLIAKATKGHFDAVTARTITDYARECCHSAKTSIWLLQKLFLHSLFNPKTWWDVFFIKSNSMILALSTIIDDPDVDPSRDALASLKLCMTILKKCGEFSPTMKNFANVATDLSRTMIVTAASLGGGSKAQQGSRHSQEDSFPSICHEVATPSTEGIQLDSSTSADAAEQVIPTGPEPSLMDRFAVDWEFSEMASHLNWDDIGAWIIQP